MEKKNAWLSYTDEDNIKIEEISRNYIVITFLSILDLTKKHEISIEQDNNFNDIIIKTVEVK